MNTEAAEAFKCSWDITRYHNVDNSYKKLEGKEGHKLNFWNTNCVQWNETSVRELTNDHWHNDVI